MELSINRRFIGSAIISILLAALSIWCFTVWQKADWMKIDTNGSKFTKIQYVSFITYIVVTPGAFMLSLSTIQRFIRYKVSSRNFLYWFMIACMSVMGYFFLAYYFTSKIESLKCGIIFCTHSPSKTIENTSTTLNAAGVGYYSLLAYQWVPIYLSIGVGTLAAIYALFYQYFVIHIKNAYTHTSSASVNLLETEQEDDMNQNILKTSSVSTLRTKTRTWMYFALFSVFLLTIWTVSTYLPNFWRQWAPMNLANQALKHVEHSKDLCKTPAANFTCPEYEHAWLKTSMIRFTDYFVMKFYPGNAMFYSFLFLLPLAALLLTHAPKLDATLSGKIRVPTCLTDLIQVAVGYKEMPPVYSSTYATNANNNPNLRNKVILPEQTVKRIAYVSYKEIVVIITTLSLLGLTFTYWFNSHNWKNHWPKREMPLDELFYRSLGQVSVVAMSLLLFPAARNSPILALFGISWEQSIKYHRWMGSTFMFLLLAHVGVVWYHYISTDQMHMIYNIYAKLDGVITDWTVPLMSYFGVVIFIGMFPLRSDWFRRKHYNIFKIVHNATYMVLFPATLLHAPMSWEFLLPGFLIWVVDRGVRVYRSIQKVDVSYTSHSRTNITINYDAHEQNKTAITEHKYNLTRNFNTNTNTTTTTTTTNSHLFSETPEINRKPGICAVRRGESGDFVEIRLKSDTFQYRSGHYAFLNIAEISLHEWHPFTIASAPETGEIVFVIKAMYEGAWTTSLFDYVYTYQQGENGCNDDSHVANVDGYSRNMYSPVPITVSIDGPHGEPIDFSNYTDVVLVSGGVGFTPALSIFDSLYLQHMKSSDDSHNYNNYAPNTANSENTVNTTIKPNQRVHLQSYSRDVSLFNNMSSILSKLPQKHPQFTANLVCTKNLRLVPTTVNPALAKHIEFGRPDLEQSIRNAINLKPDNAQELEYLDHEGTDEDNRKVLVFVCGPEQLSVECESICLSLGWDFHTECFEL